MSGPAGGHGQWHAASIARLRAFAQGAESVALTHFHADHAGGVAARGCPSPRTRPRPTRPTRGSGDPWLGFEIPPYRVDRALRDGDTVGELVVVHTPGQTPGHVAYWHEPTRTAITGDLMQHGDVAWVPFGGPWADGALARMVESVRTIAALGPARCISGPRSAGGGRAGGGGVHAAALRAVRRRAGAGGWHAVRRALVSHLMIRPLTAAQLAELPWAPVAAEALGESPGRSSTVRWPGSQRGVVAGGVPSWVTTLPHE